MSLTDIITYLEDIEVETVGLVDKGAVGVFGDGRNFFLFKRQKEKLPMTKDELLEALAKMLTTDPAPPATTPPAPAVAPPAEEGPALLALKDMLEKSQQTISDQQTVVAGLTERLAKTEAEVKASQEALAKKELEAAQKIFIQKARQWPNLARQPETLGKALYAASVALEAEPYQIIEDALAGADALLQSAGAWAEFGSTELPSGGLLEKADRIAKEKGISFKDALLSLPAHEQEAILKGEV